MWTRNKMCCEMIWSNKVFPDPWYFQIGMFNDKTCVDLYEIHAEICRSTATKGQSWVLWSIILEKVHPLEQISWKRQSVGASSGAQNDSPFSPLFPSSCTVVHIMEVPPLDKKLVHTLIFAKVYSLTESRWSLNDSRSTSFCWWFMRRFRFIKTFRLWLFEPIF